MSFDRHSFHAEPLSVRAALVRLEHGAVLAPLGPDARDCVLLVLAEVLNNVAEHAYGGAAGPVTVSLRRDNGRVVARVLDRGGVAPSFSNGRKIDPEALPEGGFGFGLIRALAGAVCQKRRMGCNVLRMSMDAHNPV